MEEINALPILTPEEIRVLGSLIEKSKTTPEYYPLTLNSLVTACNQKSARNPVVEYDETIVAMTLDSLKKKQLSGSVIGAGSRAVKYRQNLAVTYPLDPAELALLCLLFLRGPLTAGEMNSNAGRLHEFDDLAEVQQTLENLSTYNPPFVTQLPRKPGQKESRYCHLFEPVPDFDESFFEQDVPVRKNVSELEQRLERVESELAELKDRFERLMEELS